MKASILPSGDSSGYTAESVKNVNCSHFPVPFGLGFFVPQYKRAVRARAEIATPAAHTRAEHFLRCATTPANFPISVSRLRRCRSVRISETCWERRVRSFSRHLSIISSSLGGTQGLSCDGGT